MSRNMYINTVDNEKPGLFEDDIKSATKPKSISFKIDKLAARKSVDIPDTR